MTLVELIRKGARLRTATANPATGRLGMPKVATVADRVEYSTSRETNKGITPSQAR
jgi:hypothetical protein